MEKALRNFVTPMKTTVVPSVSVSYQQPRTLADYKPQYNYTTNTSVPSESKKADQSKSSMTNLPYREEKQNDQSTFYVRSSSDNKHLSKVGGMVATDKKVLFKSHKTYEPSVSKLNQGGQK